MNLKKLDSKKEFYLLDNLPYNILHEAIRQKKWHFFLEINIFIIKDLLFFPDVTKSTPFHQVFSLADHLTISHLIKEASQGGILTEEIFKEKNAKGQNLIHLLIENKRLEHQDLKQILILIKSCCNLKSLLSSPDNFHWIPLSYYFLIKFKRGTNFLEWIKNHLEIIDLLMPNPESFINSSKEFIKEDFCFYLCCYPLIDLKAKKKSEFLKNFETFAKNYTIFNNKFLEVAFDRNSEDLLLFLLKKIPNLEINSYINNYDFGLTKKTHSLELILKNNWVNAISMFFSRNNEKFFMDYKETELFKFLNSESEIFKVFFENSGAEKENPYFCFSFSLMDEVIIGLKAIKSEAFYSKTADLIFKKMSEVFQSYSNEKRERILMNISLQVNPKAKKSKPLEDSITLADLFDLDDNQMIELFE